MHLRWMCPGGTAHGSIDEDDILPDMIEDRNRGSHIYNDAVADAIFQRIKSVYAGKIRQLLERLQVRIGWLRRRPHPEYRLATVTGSTTLLARWTEGAAHEECDCPQGTRNARFGTLPQGVEIAR